MRQRPHNSTTSSKVLERMACNQEETGTGGPEIRTRTGVGFASKAATSDDISTRERSRGAAMTAQSSSVVDSPWIRRLKSVQRDAHRPRGTLGWQFPQQLREERSAGYALRAWGAGFDNLQNQSEIQSGDLSEESNRNRGEIRSHDLSASRNTAGKDCASILRPGYLPFKVGGISISPSPSPRYFPFKGDESSTSAAKVQENILFSQENIHVSEENITVTSSGPLCTPVQSSNEEPRVILKGKCENSRILEGKNENSCIVGENSENRHVYRTPERGGRECGRAVGSAPYRWTEEYISVETCSAQSLSGETFPSSAPKVCKTCKIEKPKTGNFEDLSSVSESMNGSPIKARGSMFQNNDLCYNKKQRCLVEKGLHNRVQGAFPFSGTKTVPWSAELTTFHDMSSTSSCALFKNIHCNNSEASNPSVLECSNDVNRKALNGEHTQMGKALQINEFNSQTFLSEEEIHKYDQICSKKPENVDGIPELKGGSPNFSKTAKLWTSRFKEKCLPDRGTLEGSNLNGPLQGSLEKVMVRNITESSKRMFENQNCLPDRAMLEGSNLNRSLQGSMENVIVRNITESSKRTYENQSCLEDRAMLEGSNLNGPLQGSLENVMVRNITESNKRTYENQSYNKRGKQPTLSSVLWLQHWCCSNIRLTQRLMKACPDPNQKLQSECLIEASMDGNFTDASGSSRILQDPVKDYSVERD